MLRKTMLTLICATLFLAGCASTKPDFTAIKTVKKVALVTISLERVGKGPENDPVLKSAVGFAKTVYRQELEKIQGWQVVPAPGVAELEAQFADIASSKIARKVLVEMADQQRLDVNLSNAQVASLALAAFSGNKQAMADMKNALVDDALAQMQADLSAKREEIYWPQGMAGIPPTWSWSAPLQEVVPRILDDYRLRNGLDAVILVHQISEVGSPGDIRIVVQNNRVLSTIKVNPTFELRGTGGKLLFAEGSSRRDDLAPMKWKMPIFVGDKSGGPIRNLRLSLADPAGKGQEGYYILISDTAKDVVKDVKKVLQKAALAQ